MQYNAQCNKRLITKRSKLQIAQYAAKGPKSKKHPNSEKTIKILKSSKKSSKFWELTCVCIISELGLVKTVSLL